MSSLVKALLLRPSNLLIIYQVTRPFGRRRPSLWNGHKTHPSPASHIQITHRHTHSRGHYVSQGMTSSASLHYLALTMRSQDSLRHMWPMDPEGETGGCHVCVIPPPPLTPQSSTNTNTTTSTTRFPCQSRLKALSDINVQLPLVKCYVKCAFFVPCRFVLHFLPPASLCECMPRWVGSGWPFSEHVYDRGREVERQKWWSSTGWIPSLSVSPKHSIRIPKKQHKLFRLNRCHCSALLL